MTATPKEHTPAHGAEVLERIAIASDRLAVDARGMMTVDGVSVDDLLGTFGTPLVVSVERTILANYARIGRAFRERWDGPVEILYSFKSNNTLAIRTLLSHAGAGGDCFGEAELRATLETGTDPVRIALNGSDKSPDLIRLAVAEGVTINIDGEEEAAFIERACHELGRRAKVNLRLKVLPEALDHFMGGSALKHGPGVESVRRAKWGFTRPRALEILKGLLASPAIEVLGFSCHIGHLSNEPAAFAAVTGAFGATVLSLSKETGFTPSVLDIGGGWAREREPEQRAPSMTPVPIESQVEAALDALKGSIATLGGVPALWVEPGRYIVGNGQLILASVGAVKTDAGYAWAHVDVSTNNLPRIETGGFWYHILPASKMKKPYDATYQVVGGTCFRSVLGADRRLPTLARGDIVAILDAGMYAEVFANQFNGMPRPAGVLVGMDGSVELIRQAETAQDVFARHVIPSRLAKSTGSKANAR
ncbi:MAG: hypothetical protein AB7F09_07035 [Parvibaculaceae bacterium]